MMRICVLLSAALVAGVVGPSAVMATDLTLQYTSAQYSTTPNFTPSTTINLPIYGGNRLQYNFAADGYLRFGIQATVTNNPNSVGNLARGVENGVPQPAQLGLTVFETFITNSNGASLAPRTTIQSSQTVSTAIINSGFASAINRGVVDAATGDIGTGPIVNRMAAGTNIISTNTLDPDVQTRLRVGTTGSTAGDNLFLNLAYQFSTVGGPTVLTPTFSVAAFNFATPDNTTMPGDAPRYYNRSFNAATDTFTGPGALTIVTPEPTSLALIGVSGAALLARRRKA